MALQTLITGLLVLACSGYAAWTLMPAALRNRLRLRFGLDTTPAASGCGSGCDGCGSAKPAAAVQPIHIVRRPPSA